jgi:hypothetical protein
MALFLVAFRLVSSRTWIHWRTRTHAPPARVRRPVGHAQEGARDRCARGHGQRTMRCTSTRASPPRLWIRHSTQHSRTGSCTGTRRTPHVFHHGRYDALDENTSHRYGTTRARGTLAHRERGNIDPIIGHATFESALANEYWVASSLSPTPCAVRSDLPPRARADAAARAHARSPRTRPRRTCTEATPHAKSPPRYAHQRRRTRSPMPRRRTRP